MRSDKPDLDQAIRRMAADDRRSPTGHPDPEELLAYHERQLREAAAENVRDHLARCPECARVVLDFEAFPDLEPPDEEHRLTPADVERERRALEARIEARSRPVWQRHHVLLPLAAALFLGALGLGAWGFTLQHRLERATGPRGDVWIVADLRPASEPLRGPEPTAHVPDWAERAVLLLSLRPGREHPAYRVDVVSPEGRLLVSDLPVRRGPDGLLAVELPRELLTPGELRLDLRGSEGDTWERVAEYRFELAGP